MTRRAAIGIAACLGTLGFLAPPAGAGTQGPTVSLGTAGTIEYLRTKYPEVVTQAGPVTNCTSGDFAIGGGASISGSGAISHLNASAPLNPGQGWVAEGRTLGIGGRTVTGWAICSGAQPSLTSATEGLDPGASLNSGFSCPAGQSMLSGGAEAQAGDIVINGMFPRLEISSWTYSIENLGASGATGRASLLCAEVDQRFRAKTEPVEPQRASTVIATCPVNQVVAGGGFKMARNGVWQHNVWALTTRPWDSPDDADKVPEDGWLIKSYNDTDNRVALTAYASCLKL